MELICRIISQTPLQEREYQNQQTGMPERFATRGFVLQHGADTFYAEAVQEQARKLGDLSKDYYYMATLQLQDRPWTDQQQQLRHENRITLTKICVL